MVYAREGLDEDSIQLLKKYFKNQIAVCSLEDPLIANMIVTSNCVVSENLPKDVSKVFDKLGYSHLEYQHPSKGGGGAHKCCSNVISKNGPISVDDWLNFNSLYDIKTTSAFIIAVLQETVRLKSFYDQNLDQDDNF